MKNIEPPFEDKNKSTTFRPFVSDVYFAGSNVEKVKFGPYHSLSNYFAIDPCVGILQTAWKVGSIPYSASIIRFEKNIFICIFTSDDETLVSNGSSEQWEFILAQTSRKYMRYGDLKTSILFVGIFYALGCLPKSYIDLYLSRSFTLPAKYSPLNGPEFL